MTRTIGVELPDALYGALDDDDLEAHEGLTFLLLSVREDGWPHLAMLSVGELLALHRRRLRIALWQGSTAARNLSRRGRATLAAVLEQTSFTVKLSVGSAGEFSTVRAGTLDLFDATVEEVRIDVAPYAILESGVRFRLKDRAEVLLRWAEIRGRLREDEAT